MGKRTPKNPKLTLGRENRGGERSLSPGMPTLRIGEYELGENVEVSSAVAFGNGHAVQTVRSVMWSR